MYRRALRGLTRRRRTTIDVGAVICPTVPILPHRLDELDDVSRGGSLTRPFNVLDWPTISVPIGDLPVGLQIAVPRGRDAILWALASRVSKADGADRAP